MTDAALRYEKARRSLPGDDKGYEWAGPRDGLHVVPRVRGYYTVYDPDNPLHRGGDIGIRLADISPVGGSFFAEMSANGESNWFKTFDAALEWVSNQSYVRVCHLVADLYGEVLDLVPDVVEKLREVKAGEVEDGSATTAVHDALWQMELAAKQIERLLRGLPRPIEDRL